MVLVRKRGKPLAYCWWLILLSEERVKMKIDLSYKQCCIIKHALRDKPNRDPAEELLYQQFYDIVAATKELHGDNQTALNHEPVPHGSRNIILR